MKRTLQFISCLLVLLFSNNCLSQEGLTTPIDSSDFLKNYIPPNYTYTIWSLQPDILSSSTVSEDFNRNSFSSGVRTNFSFREQQDKSDTYLFATLDENFRTGKTQDLQNPNENFFDHRMFVNGQRDFFFKDKFFVGIGADYVGQLDRDLIEDWNSSIRNDGSIDLGVGYGRIYTVTTAWTATSIFNDLEGYGVEVDRSYAKELADLIRTQSRTRIFDNRLMQIQNRTELFTFLDANNIATLTPLTAAVIDDTFGNETFRGRQSGYRFFGGLRPSVNSFTTRSSTEEDNSRDFELIPIVEFDYNLPISEDWQFDVNTSIALRSLTGDAIDKNTRSSASVSLAWLPTQRVRSALSAFYSGTYNVNEDISDFTSVSLGYALRYYFNPRLTLDFNASISNIWTKNIFFESSTFGHRISLGFNYAIL